MEINVSTYESNALIYALQLVLYIKINCNECINKYYQLKKMDLKAVMNINFNYEINIATKKKLFDFEIFTFSL